MKINKNIIKSILDPIIGSKIDPICISKDS